MNKLSKVAKQAGLETNWKCWKNGTIFSDIGALLEICKRIEQIELHNTYHRNVEHEDIGD